VFQHSSAHDTCRPTTHLDMADERRASLLERSGIPTSRRVKTYRCGDPNIVPRSHTFSRNGPWGRHRTSDEILAQHF
jgi:hypothetical protein